MHQAVRENKINDVSIPHGTIKSGLSTTPLPTNSSFQFHMVRLKVYNVRSGISDEVLFQFHMVRLKGLKYERCDC